TARQNMETSCCIRNKTPQVDACGVLFLSEEGERLAGCGMCQEIAQDIFIIKDLFHFCCKLFQVFL
ncbi:MAG TPA: hypothetical protein PK414_14010, partial [Anaerolineales bacterium]|nr:hypothetical protein [Anaerolineales bacterium]HNC09269.1 hypothetical protein [Anaerolineales bacterium]